MTLMVSKLKFIAEKDKLRFLSYFQEDEKSGCWLWLKGVTCKGYGQFGLNCKNVRAHRVSFFNFVSEFDESLEVLHECDTPPCVNPTHLFLGTNDDNRKDSMLKSRHNRGSRNGNASLNEKLVEEIISRSDEPLLSLAAEFLVSENTIRRVILNEGWKHVSR